MFVLESYLVFYFTRREDNLYWWHEIILVCRIHVGLCVIIGTYRFYLSAFPYSTCTSSPCTLKVVLNIYTCRNLCIGNTCTYPLFKQWINLGNCYFTRVTLCYVFLNKLSIIVITFNVLVSSYTNLCRYRRWVIMLEMIK